MLDTFMFKPLLVFCCLFLFIFSARATPGCIGSLTGDLYLTASSGMNYAYGQPTMVPNGSYDTYCIFSQGTSGSCHITGVPFFGTVNGALVDFSPYPCSLDNYSFILFVGLGGIGFASMRKNAKSSCLNENHSFCS